MSQKLSMFESSICFYFDKKLPNYTYRISISQKVILKNSLEGM